jgi:hypothetical protein
MTAGFPMAASLMAELTEFLSPAEKETLARAAVRLKPKSKGAPVPADWRERVPLIFPKSASAPFAKRHADLWDWGNAIELDSAPDPFVAAWPRGGAKSTSAEMLTSDLGTRGKRRYALYVRMTQDKADDSVQNIASLLESDTIERHYPEHAKRKVGKHGNSRGWRRNRVWTAGGFVADALGLDTASRGVKLEEQRPDLIIFDDVDDLNDSPAATAKKIGIITKSILPAGSNNVAVLFIQNLIIGHGVATQLVDGRADFLAKRKVSGPFPAVEGLEYEWKLDENGIRRAIITKGTATWAGQPIEACQRFIDTWGLSAFIKEAQHQVQGKGEGVVLRFEPARHYADLTLEKVHALVTVSRAFGGIDFGAWRFGCVLFIQTPAGIVVRVGELFSQREVLNIRARKIHEMCVALGIKDPSPKTVPLWGDAANPQDIMEMNLAFRNGWEDENTGERTTSKLRVIAVANEGKIRRAAVERINNALDQNLLKFVRSVGSQDRWYLGMNAGNTGTEQHRSRLMWEIDNWAVAVPKEGEAQDQNPDDDTADGADCIAAARYALMSFWKAPRLPAEAGHYDNDRAWPFDPKAQRFKEPPHVADPLLAPSGRKRPSVRAPRARLPR